MHRYILILLILIAGCSTKTDSANQTSASPVTCTNNWYQFVENAVQSGDGQGHGPDIGSEEWQSVVEFKLGVRGNPEVPSKDSQAWCDYINSLLTNN
ncbi:MAG TPA: hypothetical protein VIC26_15660 [Marinagarivorans sp.]